MVRKLTEQPSILKPKFYSKVIEIFSLLSLKFVSEKNPKCCSHQKGKPKFASEQKNGKS